MQTITQIIKIEPTERCISVGRTGSGKTVLNTELIRNWPYLFVIDVKGEIKLPKSTVIDNPYDLTKVRASNPCPIIYTPKPEYDEDDIWNNIYEWLYQRGNCSVYTDELFAVMTAGGRPPKWLKAIQTRGRSLHIRSLGSTQRPFGIPLTTLSETDHVIMFSLIMDDDKKRMAQIIGPIAMRPLLDDYHYYYKRIGDSEKQARTWAKSVGIPEQQVLTNGVIEMTLKVK